MTLAGARAKGLAGDSPLERRVRQHGSLGAKLVPERPAKEGPAAEAPARRDGTVRVHSAARADGERRQLLPRGGGSTDWLEAAHRETEIRGREARRTEQAWQMLRAWHLSDATQSVTNLQRGGQRVHLAFGGDCGPAKVASTFSAPWCCLTFELRRERRDGAWPARPMIRTTASRAKCHAGASRLQRRVRRHCAALLQWRGLSLPERERWLAC